MAIIPIRNVVKYWRKKVIIMNNNNEMKIKEEANLMAAEN